MTVEMLRCAQHDTFRRRSLVLGWKTIARVVRDNRKMEKDFNTEDTEERSTESTEKKVRQCGSVGCAEA